MFLLTKLKAWALGLMAAVLAVAGAYLAGRWKGSSAAKVKAEVSQQRAQIHAQDAQARIDAEVDHEIAKLPDAPAQRVGDAAPATAAGRLRTDWMR
ncbi:hypothetical protein [Mizugakiibacter sediminis]|nr:hypothetical protein [Mizugakiibacter sediminis]